MANNVPFSGATNAAGGILLPFEQGEILTSAILSQSGALKLAGDARATATRKEVFAIWQGQPIAQFVGEGGTKPVDGGEFGAGLVAAELVLQVIQNQLWYIICECSSGTQPTPPTGQSEPTGLVQINPPAIVTNNPVDTCLTATSPTGQQSALAAFRLFGVRLTAGGGPPMALPAGATLIRAVLTSNSVGATHKTALFSYYPYPTPSQENPSNQFLVASGASRTVDIAVPAGNYGFCMDLGTSDGTSTTDTGFATIAVYCGGQPGQIQTPCCPPDPQLTGMVTRILEYVTLIQRQAVPFGYVPGTAHTGLSGAGQLSISGLLGVKVDITTQPSRLGTAGSSPERVFDAGYITFGTADGWPTSYRVNADPTLALPARCSAYTELDYDLSTGVVVTITELLREP